MGEMISHPTVVSTFASPHKPTLKPIPKAFGMQKSFHLTDPKKNFKIFFQRFKKIKNSTHSRHSMTQKLNTDNGLQGRWTNTTGYNK